jgi:glutaryl-CoA dehydrogenase
MAFPFKGVDFIGFEALLSEEERLTRDTARQFIEDNLIPIIEECNREGRFPRELVPQMGQLGFFGANLHGYGCAGMSNVEYGLVMQEFERGDSGVRSFVSVQSALVMYPIYTFGSDEQKDDWLPLLARGEKLGCFGLTEPDFGSNPGGMRTRARKVGDEYILNGEKMWITSGTISDVAVIWAKVDDEDGRVRGFLRCSWKMVAARLGHFGAFAAGRACSSEQPATRDRWPEVGADVSEPSAVRHRLGGHRRRDVLL